MRHPGIPFVALICLFGFMGFGCDEADRCDTDADCEGLCSPDEEAICVRTDPDEEEGICECEPNGGTGGTAGSGGMAGSGGTGGTAATGGTGGSSGTGGTGGTGGMGGGASGACDMGFPSGAPAITTAPLLLPDFGVAGDTIEIEFNFNDEVTEFGWLLIRSGFGDVAGNGNQLIDPGVTSLTVEFDIADVPADDYVLQLLMFGNDPDLRIGYATPEDCESPMEASVIENGVEGPFNPLPGCPAVCLRVEVE